MHTHSALQLPQQHNQQVEHYMLQLLMQSLIHTQLFARHQIVILLILATSQHFLAQLMDQAAGRITLLPGSGIRPKTLPAIAHLPLREIHASCSMPQAEGAAIASFGFGPPVRRVTSETAVREMTAALRLL